MDDSPIFVRPDGDQWSTYFDGKPNLSYGGDSPIKAVRRLLEGVEAVSAASQLLNFGKTEADVDRFSILWDPPLLLFECQACEGRGEYVGLFEKEVCRGCGGRKMIPV